MLLLDVVMTPPTPFLSICCIFFCLGVTLSGLWRKTPGPFLLLSPCSAHPAPGLPDPSRVVLGREAAPAPNSVYCPPCQTPGQTALSMGPFQWLPC